MKDAARWPKPEVNSQKIFRTKPHESVLCRINITDVRWCQMMSVAAVSKEQSISRIETVMNLKKNLAKLCFEDLQIFVKKSDTSVAAVDMPRYCISCGAGVGGSSTRVTGALCLDSRAG